MEKSKATLFFMILNGFVRLALTSVGTWMMVHQVINQTTHQLLVSSSDQITGAVIIFLVAVWSAMQKTQVWHRMLVALHMDRNSTVHEIKVEAAERSIAPKVTL